jgi:hypothetical protein
MDMILSVRIPEDVADEARAQAELEHRSLSNLVRLALIRYLDRPDRTDADNHRYDKGVS